MSLPSRDDSFETGSASGICLNRLEPRSAYAASMQLLYVIVRLTCNMKFSGGCDRLKYLLIFRGMQCVQCLLSLTYWIELCFFFSISFEMLLQRLPLNVQTWPLVPLYPGRLNRPEQETSQMQRVRQLIVTPWVRLIIEPGICHVARVYFLDRDINPRPNHFEGLITVEQ